MEKEPVNKIDTDDDEEHLALIVEDDKINQNYLANALMKKNYKPYKAATVTQAIEHLLNLENMDQHFEVIFLDIILEDDETGLDFLRRRKELNLDHKGIVIVMTGNEELHVVQECNKYNIQNYIRKPVSQTNLEYEITKVNDVVKKQKCPIKGYKNVKKIGQGGTGEVFLVRNKATKELYAMKRVPIDDKKNNHETTYHSGLKAPTILELKESRNFEGFIYMIIEYAEYGTLSDWIEKQKNQNVQIDTEQILLWMTMLFLGLYETHQKNLIHRDIKSDNLFICKNNILKIGDLGIAKAVEKFAFTVCGTHHYMAPEIHKKEEYDTKADIWAAGIVLYELLMYEKPFDGSSDEIVDKVLKMEYKHIPKNMDDKLHTLIKHTLNPDPLLRYSAKNILRLDFMMEYINKINDTGLFQIEDETIYRISMEETNIDKKVTKDEMKKTILQNENLTKMIKAHLNNFFLAIKLDANAINKTTYQKGYFSAKIENCIKGGDLFLTAEENDIKDSQLEDLIKTKFLINVTNPDEEEFLGDDKNFYQIRLLEEPGVENSMITPSTGETKPKHPVKLTQDCLELATKILGKIDDLDEDDDEGKLALLGSKDYFDFLLEITQIKQINFDKLSKHEKLACVLNIYQTMYAHILIKAELYNESTNTGGGGLVGKMKSIVFTGAKKNDICYNIGGHKMTLYDLKNITVRRNKKPLDAYMRLASSGDAREKLIDGGENNKLHLVCMDPPAPNSEESFRPQFPKFSENVTKELDDYCKQFVAEFLTIDDCEISIPKFLKEYLIDFTNEQELIKFLLKFNDNPNIKASKVIRDLNSKSISLNFY